MKAWISAFRLRTLPLASASIIAGSAFAHHTGVFRPFVFGLILLTAILLQILSNLANDYGDSEHGVDNEDRVGPTRAVQSGSISPGQMKTGIYVVAGLAFFTGLFLLYIVFIPERVNELLFFLALGLASIAAAYKYTAGKNPYGYRALGDLAVFVFFGLVGVCGTYYLFAGSISYPVLMASIGFGLLSTSVLNLNNMRDLEEDKKNGKETLAVRLGSRSARIYQLFLFAFGLSMISIAYSNMGSLYYLSLSIPGLVLLFISIQIFKKQGGELDPYLKWVAITTFLVSIIPWVLILS